MLRFFKRSDITDALWDEVISSSPNGVIYATTCFLDTSRYSWEAIIYYDENHSNPYRAVMPVIINRRYGLKYLAYEPWCTQLGIFSFSEPDLKMVELFIKNTQKQGAKINKYPFEPSVGPLVEKAIAKENLIEHRLNFFDLSKPYEVLSSRYNRNRRRALKKGCALGLLFKETHDIDAYIRLFEKYTYPRIQGMIRSQLIQLKNIYETLQQEKQVEMYEVTGQGETLSIGMFLKFKTDLIYYSCTNSSAGLKQHAQSFLLDSVIRKYSGTNFTLQAYSGSHVGVTRFYDSFGAQKKAVLIWNDQKLKIRRILSGLISPTGISG